MGALRAYFPVKIESSIIVTSLYRYIVDFVVAVTFSSTRVFQLPVYQITTCLGLPFSDILSILLFNFFILILSEIRVKWGQFRETFESKMAKKFFCCRKKRRPSRRFQF